MSCIGSKFPEVDWDRPLVGKTIFFLWTKSSIVALSVALALFSLNSFSSSFYLWRSLRDHVLTSHVKYFASKWVFGNLETHDIFNYNGCKLTKVFSLTFNKSTFNLMHLLISYILMLRKFLLLPQKNVLNILFPSLMILFIVSGFI